MKVIKSIDELIELSIGHEGDCIELDCSFTIQDDDQTFEVYSVSVSNQDILLYSNKACLNYVVDLYGNRPVLELFNIEYEE